jgi:hypothetical protein
MEEATIAPNVTTLQTVFTTPLLEQHKGWFGADAMMGIWSLACRAACHQVEEHQGNVSEFWTCLRTWREPSLGKAAYLMVAPSMLAFCQLPRLAFTTILQCQASGLHLSLQQSTTSLLA